MTPAILAAALAAAQPTAGAVTVLHVTGALGADSGSCSLPGLEALVETPRSPGGSASLGDVGFGVLRDRGRFVFDPRNLGDPLASARLLSPEGRTAQVLDESLPILVTDQGVYFQWPREGLPDGLEEMARALAEPTRPGAWRGKLVRAKHGSCASPAGRTRACCWNCPADCCPATTAAPCPASWSRWSSTSP